MTGFSPTGGYIGKWQMVNDWIEPTLADMTPDFATERDSSAAAYDRNVGPICLKKTFTTDNEQHWCDGRYASIRFTQVKPRTSGIPDPNNLANIPLRVRSSRGFTDVPFRGGGCRHPAPKGGWCLPIVTAREPGQFAAPPASNSSAGPSETGYPSTQGHTRAWKYEKLPFFYEMYPFPSPKDLMVWSIQHSWE